MDLDRGTLAKIDRRVLSGLDHGETWRMVRVPVSSAAWSAWRRYCDSAGISMGRAIQVLIDRELVGVLGRYTGDDSPVLARQVEDELAVREATVASREHEVVATEERLRTRQEQLRRWEGELEAREQRVDLASKLMTRAPAARAKVGRNERCPCGSGLKYKHCHGLPGRLQSVSR
jgi:hypothetical protein